MPRATKSKPRRARPKVSAVEAVAAAERFLGNFYDGGAIEDLRVEGVELDPLYFGKGWSVILSFIPAQSETAVESRRLALPAPRLYKEFWVQGTDSDVVRMGDPIDQQE